MKRVRCDQTSAWQALRDHFDQSASQLDMREAFLDEPERLSSMHFNVPYIKADLSKNLLDESSHKLLTDLARECGLETYRDAMFAGGAINSTEQRSVMHWLLRYPAEAPAHQAQAASEFVANAHADVHHTLDAMLALAERVRVDDSITDIVNIGIGGSDLGPAMVVGALEDWRHPGKKFHFVSNVDGQELGLVLSQVKPRSTLFLVASKSFTTAETMVNAQAARAWFLEQGGSEDKGAEISVARHFVALTSNVEAAARFGTTTTLGFWDWVGGRYSLWSAIGLPIAISIGAEGFRQLLAGAHAMDEHFRTAPLEQNLPVRMGLIDLWYRNFYGFTSRCIAPYSHSLRRLPAYLQQLEMESNGKGLDTQGQALPFATSPAIWGEPGTNGQHAFFQMIHQGADVIPVEFIAMREGGRHLPQQQEKLVINAIAQAQALLVGRVDEAGAKYCPGNRPSTFFVLQRLEPASLGALLALYEHRVFVSGALWGINSFDQWGVELGKKLAQDLSERCERDEWTGIDASTQQLVRQLLA